MTVRESTRTPAESMRADVERYFRLRVSRDGHPIIGRIERIEVRHARDGEGRLRYEEGKPVRHAWLLLRVTRTEDLRWLKLDDIDLLAALRGALAAHGEPEVPKVGSTMAIRCHGNRWRVDYHQP